MSILFIKMDTMNNFLSFFTYCDEKGYDKDGYNYKEFNKDGVHKNGTLRDGEGYDKDGYNNMN